VSAIDFQIIRAAVVLRA